MNAHEEFCRVRLEVYGEPSPRPMALIQWKGTSACIDLHCACGVHGHLDDEAFMYVVACGSCGAVYAVDETVRLIPITPHQQQIIGHEPVVFDGPPEE